MCLFSFKIFVSSQIEVLQATCRPIKCDMMNDFKLFPTVCVYREYTAGISINVIQSDVQLQ